MAAEKIKTGKIERDYTVPLRKHWRRAPPYKRAKRAVNALRRFLAKHMKVAEENVKIGKELNERIFARGFRNPPPRVEITVLKEMSDKDYVVKSNLKGVPYAESKKEEMAEKKEEKPEKRSSKK